MFFVSESDQRSHTHMRRDSERAKRAKKKGNHLVTVIQDHKEEVETRHDGRAEVHIRLEALASVIAPPLRVRGSENRGAGIERRLNAGFGDGDGLLLHGLVDRHLRAG